MTVKLINDCVFISNLPDWSTPPFCERDWQTEIIEGIKGGEKRNAMRAVPLRTACFMVTSGDIAERVRLEARIDAAKKTGFAACPLHGRTSFLSAAVAANANSISVNAPGWNWRAGDYVALIADDETFDVAAVTAADAGVLTLATNLTYDWPQDQLVWPVIFGKFSGTDKEAALDGHDATWKITVKELTSGRSAQIGATPAVKLGIGQMQVGQNFTVGGK